MTFSSGLTTPGVLETIMNGGTVTEAIVQLIGSKKMITSNENHRYRLLVSDGKYKVNVALYTVQSHLLDPHALEPHTILKLNRYMTNVVKNKDEQDTRILLILELEVLARGDTVGHLIGDPVCLSDEFTNSQRSEFSSFNGKIVSLYRTKRERFRHPHECKILSPISSLNPFHHNWVIKARVVNKSIIRTWSNSRGEGKLFTVDFVDKGGEIRCTAFRELVDKFYDLLEVDSVYFVAKCVLQPINRQFCALKHDFEMSMTSETIIEKSLEDNDMVPQIKYNFTTIDKLVSMVAGTIVDVIAICKSVSELQNFTSKTTNRELRKKEVLLIDQSKTGIVLTLWNNRAETFTFSDNVTISIKNAKIQEYQGTKSLTTTLDSQIYINPDVSESVRLKHWFETEGHQLDFQNITIRNGSGDSPWMTFKQAQQRSLDDDQSFIFQTFATILLIRLDRSVYKACPTGECQKKVIDLENGMFRCEKCNREYDGFKYRLLLSMNVSDSSTSQWVTVFSGEAEKILGKSAGEIGDALENDQESVSKVFEEVQFEQYLLKCRAKTENYNDEQKVKIVVISVKNVNFEQFNGYLLKKIEELR